MHGTCNALYSTENRAELAEKSMRMCLVSGHYESPQNMIEMGEDFSLEFSFAEFLQGTYQTSCPYGGVYSFIYYLMLYVCMYVCVFVCYKKGSNSFDTNNAKFIQKIDDCTGR